MTSSTFIDLDALTFTWDLGDATTGTGPTPPALHSWSDNGTYQITLSAHDGTESHAATATATIANAAPAITLIAAPVHPVPVNTAILLNAGFTDAGTADAP